MKEKYASLILALFFPIIISAQDDSMTVSFKMDSNSDVDRLSVWLCDSNDEYMSGYSELLTKQKPLIKKSLSCNSLGLYPFHPKHHPPDRYVQPSATGINVLNYFPVKTCYVQFNNDSYTIHPQSTITIDQKDIQSNNSVVISCNTIKN
ncbi:MAG: hypothetical protein CL816_02895 [Coxiellaceae bacterium]|nr:hypothetical protein [Coxiellaceae bacterium]